MAFSGCHNRGLLWQIFGFLQLSLAVTILYVTTQWCRNNVQVQNLKLKFEHMHDQIKNAETQKNLYMMATTEVGPIMVANLLDTDLHLDLATPVWVRSDVF